MIKVNYQNALSQEELFNKKSAILEAYEVLTKKTGEGNDFLPRWIESFSGAKPIYTFTSGGDFPADLSDYKLIVHCGGCMLNEKEMAHRMEIAARAGVPMVNYGVAIAHIHGILRQSLAPFPDVLKMLEE